MKLDWPHTIALLGVMAFVVVLVVVGVRYPTSGVLPVVLPIIGIVGSLAAAAWRGGQLAGRSADSAPTSGDRSRNGN